MRLRFVLVGMALIIMFDIVLSNCKPAAVAPSIDLAACVTKEAGAGKSIAEIAVACETDVPAVIIALVTKNELKETRAYGEALRVKAVIAGTP